MSCIKYSILQNNGSVNMFTVHCQHYRKLYRWSGRYEYFYWTSSVHTSAVHSQHYRELDGVRDRAGMGEIRMTSGVDSPFLWSADCIHVDV